MKIIFDAIDDDELLPAGVWTVFVKFSARKKCKRCGFGHNLHAHHIDEDKKNNRLNNGECLCRWCHLSHHASKTASTRAAQQRREALAVARRGIPQGPFTETHISHLRKPKSTAGKENIKKGVINAWDEGSRRQAENRRDPRRLAAIRQKHRVASQQMWAVGGSRYHEREKK